MTPATDRTTTRAQSTGAAQPVLPGATLGVFGSGQLGRMFAQAAQRLGYRVHVFSPAEDSPTGQVADQETVASYDDLDAVARFAESVDVISLEFENVPVAAASAAAERVPVRPSPQVLHAVQHRHRERCFLRKAGIPCTPFHPVASLAGLEEACATIGTPAVLKTSVGGYDGKGQALIATADGASAAWQALGSQDLILEEFVEFEREISMLAARGLDGLIATYGPITNSHTDHILDVSIMPDPQADDALRHAAAEIARTVVEQLDVVGILCVEFFVARSGQLLVNEIAPRPHNSGHLTIDACVTSQFEQQVRAVCGLPLGSPALLRPAAMANLLGDLWSHGTPRWADALALPGVSLHLYGKNEPRPGRKMGHLTALADTPEQADRLVRAARAACQSSAAG